MRYFGGFSRCSFFFFFAGALLAQHQPVSPFDSYHRILCVVPMVGKGTHDDPRRPMYVAHLLNEKPTHSGIIAFTHIVSDDGNMAIVELVATDRDAFKDLFADRSLRIFEKGRHTRVEMEAEFRRFRKDFSFETFPRLAAR